MTFTGKTVAVIDSAWHAPLCVRSILIRLKLFSLCGKKNPQWHLNVACISFGFHFKVILPKAKYFPVVVGN